MLLFVAVTVLNFGGGGFAGGVVEVAGEVACFFTGAGGGLVGGTWTVFLEGFCMENDLFTVTPPVAVAVAVALVGDCVFGCVFEVVKEEEVTTGF